MYGQDILCGISMGTFDQIDQPRWGPNEFAHQIIAKTNQRFVCKCMKTAQPMIYKESNLSPQDKMAPFSQTIFSEEFS